MGPRAFYYNIYCNKWAPGPFITVNTVINEPGSRHMTTPALLCGGSFITAHLPCTGPAQLGVFTGVHRLSWAQRTAQSVQNSIMYSNRCEFVYYILSLYQQFRKIFFFINSSIFKLYYLHKKLYYLRTIRVI